MTSTETPRPASKKRFKNALVYGFAPIGLAVAALTLIAARYEPVIRPNIAFGKVDVGGLTREEAKKKLRVWWEMEKSAPLTLTSSVLKNQPATTTPVGLGLAVDDEATAAQVALEDFWEMVSRSVGIDAAPPKSYPIQFKWDAKKSKSLVAFVNDQVESPRKALVKYDGRQFIRQRESAGFELDVERLQETVLQALETGGKGQLPITEAPKRVPDAALDSINEVRTSYSTRFSTGKVTRCANIKLASSILDGVVLMPGDRFSFNDTVGRRTQKSGFKIAGVYKNGRHDFDVGGGICQVSTTLYNAALLSNLKIVQRSNHSMPVPYVPLGRDATVDYGSHDLVFENNLDTPIAVSCQYSPGKLTFTILGKKDPSLSVKIVTSGHRSWSRGVKFEHNGSLPYGKTLVTEKGSSGHSCVSTRLVYRDGKLVAREPLGQSYYAGAVRIIAKNMKASPPTQVAEEPIEGGEPTPEEVPVPPTDEGN
ncbi:MAG: hypothetical protein HONBIEJF_02337 [Fimbriimonadaceae bacterium]|nr:hypothetical protein [Fimbriimonadaceae bacterium]